MRRTRSARPPEILKDSLLLSWETAAVSRLRFFIPFCSRWETGATCPLRTQRCQPESPPQCVCVTSNHLTVSHIEGNDVVRLVKKISINAIVMAWWIILVKGKGLGIHTFSS